LNELESQNDGQVEGIMGKVRLLKDVSRATYLLSPSPAEASGRTDAELTSAKMTLAIGDEIRDSSALAEKMNDSFDSTRVRLRGTMNRMLLMAERTGVGWKVWLAFFAAVVFLFFYVWV
jgi:blocked-early-in-transport protein 1